MEAPFAVEIKCSDASGKEFVLFRNSELGYEQLIAVQAALGEALIGLGKAGAELKKAK